MKSPSVRPSGAFALTAGSILLLGFTLFTCRTPGGSTGTDLSGKGVKERLDRIREVYKPNACFRTDFSVEVVQHGERPMKAVSVVRADNTNKRMKFQVMDPFFGVTLSDALITQDTVIVKTFREKRREFPADQFEVRGLGSNSIALPFRLFQDLIYGRIPDEVYKMPARLDAATNTLTVDVKTGGEEYRYEFGGERLRRLFYRRADMPGEIEVTLEGTYRDTHFPQSIRMEAGEKNAPRDQFTITFTGLNLEAKCTDGYFSPPAP